MDKMLVVVFDNESKAYEGVKALKDLHDEGMLTLYATAVIAKEANGQVNVKQAADQGPAGTVLGLATGTLIGLLGGPVGLVIGATSGTMLGSIYDVAHLGVGEDYVAEVSEYLLPGKVAVVAEADEEWVTPLDVRMESLDGIVLRRARSEFIDAQISRESEATKAEVANLKAERDHAVGEAKARLQAKLDAAQNRLRARREVINEKVAAFKRAGEARIESMQAQAVKTQGDMKAKLEKRIAEERADHHARVEKLSQAWQLVKEAAAI